MARDLDFTLDIIGVPTVREEDGVARSSRNAYLTATERASAASIPLAMNRAAQDIRDGVAVGAALFAAKQTLLSAGFVSIDYCELRDGTTLALLDEPSPDARLFLAARIGSTRLIDNIAV